MNLASRFACGTFFGFAIVQVLVSVSVSVSVNVNVLRVGALSIQSSNSNFGVKRGNDRNYVNNYHRVPLATNCSSCANKRTRTCFVSMMCVRNPASTISFSKNTHFLKRHYSQRSQNSRSQSQLVRRKMLTRDMQQEATSTQQFNDIKSIVSHIVLCLVAANFVCFY